MVSTHSISPTPFLVSFCFVSFPTPTQNLPDSSASSTKPSKASQDDETFAVERVRLSVDTNNNNKEKNDDDNGDDDDELRFDIKR